MSSLSSYPTKAFSESQKFLVRDPATGSASFVLGSDLVSYITPSINYVRSETTRLSAENEDYKVGNVIHTTGATSVGDGQAALYLVVPNGEGDFPMLNGNELLVIAGDEFLREQLASSAEGGGTDLIAHTGTPETVTEAFRKRVRSLPDIAALTSLDTGLLVDRQQFSVQDGGKVRKFSWNFATSSFDELIPESTPRSQTSLKADKEPPVTKGDGTVKLLEHTAGGADEDCIVYSAKRSSGRQKYIGVYLRTGVVTTSNSAGAPGDLLRVTQIREYWEVVTWLKTPSASTLTDLNFVVGGASLDRSVSDMGDLSSQTRGDELSYNRVNAGGSISYTITGDGRRQRKANIAFFTSPTSAPADISISVNGMIVEPNLQLEQDDPRVWVVEFDLPFNQRTGDPEAVITVNNNHSTDFVYVIGANFYYLSDLPSSDVAIDAFRAFSTEEFYRDNFGANDYAIFDSDTSQFVGSFHGGETRIDFDAYADGNVYSYLTQTSGDIKLFETLSIRQETDIVSKLTSSTIHNFTESGGYSLQCYMDGNINCSIFYTTMATTGTDFNFIDYPKKVGPIVNSEENTYAIEAGQNRVSQSWTTGGGILRVSDVEYTHFEGLNSDGAFVRSQNGNYNKFYYGPVVDSDSPVNIKEISFYAVHGFR